MAQIAVTILDPSNKRSAHLVETRLPIRDVIPPIVSQLHLPAQATYQLFLLGNESALPADKSLAENGIPAGTEMQLKPVRNQILKAILEKLYDEAKGYVEDQAWDMAKEKLEALFALDPYYPDPIALEKAVASHVAFMRTMPPTEQFIGRRANPLVNRPAATSATPSSAAPSTVLPSSNVAAPRASVPPPVFTTSGRGSSAYQLAPQAAKSSGVGCLRIGLLVVAVVIIAAGAYIGGVRFLPGVLNDLAQRTGIHFPGTTILGTGDVQVTLRWQGDADLDLHVFDPNGEEIWFQSPQSSSGGTLDVDANGKCEGVSNPVENVYWPKGQAPSGDYAVSVIYYQECGRTQPTDYEVTVTLDGKVIDDVHAEIANKGENHPVTNFHYPQ